MPKLKIWDSFFAFKGFFRPINLFSKKFDLKLICDFSWYLYRFNVTVSLPW